MKLIIAAILVLLPSLTLDPAAAEAAPGPGGSCPHGYRSSGKCLACLNRRNLESEEPRIGGTSNWGLSQGAPGAIPVPPNCTRRWGSESQRRQ